jgi:starch phosphorylase
VRSAWPGVTIRALSAPPRELARAAPLRLRVGVGLNGLEPNDVAVEFVARRELPARRTLPPALASFREANPEGVWHARFNATGETEADGARVFVLDARAADSGQFRTEVRIYPSHRLLAHPLELGLLKLA